MKEFGEYPIDAHLERIGAAVQKGSACLIKAEPGAGKTTRVPLHLLSLCKGEILVLEPRRLAARLSAERSAWFLDEPCGRQVGFVIRQDKKISKETRLTFITEGLFLRLLRNNPTLQGVDAVVIDEFHERNIYTDIALALVRKLQQEKRPDLKLVVMSATLDTTALETYMEDAAVFDIQGKIFPVDIEYISTGEFDGWLGKNWESSVAATLQTMRRDPRCPGDILVFLTGIGEIMALKHRLDREIPAEEAVVLPLAADLPLQDQQRVFTTSFQKLAKKTGFCFKPDGFTDAEAPSLMGRGCHPLFEKNGPRKIVLATNVAETALTIPGITGVLDLGLAKIPAHAPWSGMPTLEIKRISQASAIQRAGRAGRVSRGLVFRQYSKSSFLNREPFTPPDIQRIDIAHPVLELLNLGYTLELIPWFEPPGEKNLESALQLLTVLGAIDPGGEITPFGKKLSVLPLHPRLAAVAQEGQESGCAEDALLAACLISERFALRHDVIPPREDEKGEPCDLAMQIDLLKEAVSKNQQLSPYPLRFLDSRQQKRVLDLYGILARVYRQAPKPPAVKTDVKKLSSCLLRGYPDRVAQRRELPAKKGGKGAPALYNFCMGRGGMIAAASFVYNEKPRFLIAVDAVESVKKDAAKGITIRVCSTLDPEILKKDPGKMLRQVQREEFDPKEGTSALWQDLFYGNLKVESRKAGYVQEGQSLAQALAENWPFPFADDEPLQIYHSRVEILNRFNIPHHCPIFIGEMREVFFEYICEGIAALKDLAHKSLETYIYQQLSESDRVVLDTYVPLEMRLKNGKRLKIHYREGKEPWAEILLQDCYGLRETPAVMEGKLRVVLHLLGPNRRQVQVTGDLAGFWQGSYHLVRKELWRRYPKHYWPENPAQAEPVSLKRLVNNASGGPAGGQTFEKV